MEYDIRPVTADLWDELTAFFGKSGAYSNCWCVWWRVTSNEFDAGCAEGGVGNRELLHKLTLEGRVPGLLAFPIGQPSQPANPSTSPLGWVSVGPRPDFGRIGRSRNLKPADDDDFDDASVWSIVCFWIQRANRGKGLGRALLAGAVSYAFEHGASVVEGYPVDTRGAKTQASSVYTGTVSMFDSAGFKEALRRADKRPVMRRYREV
jgi:GNAT superfamily N-acetyltransferase